MRPEFYSWLATASDEPLTFAQHDPGAEVTLSTRNDAQMLASNV